MTVSVSSSSYQTATLYSLHSSNSDPPSLLPFVQRLPCASSGQHSLCASGQPTRSSRAHAGGPAGTVYFPRELNIVSSLAQLVERDTSNVEVSRSSRLGGREGRLWAAALPPRCVLDPGARVAAFWTAWRRWAVRFCESGLVRDGFQRVLVADLHSRVAGDGALVRVMAPCGIGSQLARGARCARWVRTSEVSGYGTCRALG